MDLLSEGQRINIIIDDEDDIEINCTVEKVLHDRVIIELPKHYLRYIQYFDTGMELKLKAFTRRGVLEFKAMIINSPLEGSFEVEYDTNQVKIHSVEEVSSVSAIEKMLMMRNNEAPEEVRTCEIGTESLRFISTKNFEEGKSYECVLFLPEKYGKIKFTGLILGHDAEYSNEVNLKYSAMSKTTRQTVLAFLCEYDDTY